MIPGGTTELVWHFLGHLNIHDDIARDRLAYEDPAPQARPDDYKTDRPNFDKDTDLDEFSTRPLPPPEISLIEDQLNPKLHPLKSPHFPSLDDDFPLQGRLPPMPLPPPFGGGGGGVHVHIKVVYENGGEQGEVQVQQYNFMSDNDMLVIADDSQMPILLAQAEHINFHAEQLVDRMVKEAGQQIPKDWWIPKDNAGVTDFIQKFDQEQADHGGAPDAHSVAAAYYLNGALQPADTPPPTTVPGEIPPHDTGHGHGLWTDAGSNVSFNGALIVDLGESGRTMIVGGDYYHTNAIFQTNSIMDHDKVTAPDSAMPTVTTGQDTTSNIADFVQHPGVYDTLLATFAGPQWHVDVVHGNFYSINTVDQTNFLLDNDIVVQQGGSNHYDLVSGGNEQGNLMSLFDGSIHYDLIVVEGAYHGMNVIFQNNVLLNNDDIKLLTNGANPAQTVNSGQNDLLNQATIENYGNDKFAPMNDGLNGVLSDLRNGDTSLDLSVGKLLPGTGGTFDVLYVTGDYYDVNAIWQTNVTSDVNVILQLMNAPSTAASQLHPGDNGTQSVTTGQDKLTNDAAIVDVGPTNAYVGGQVYGDTILVQANLLPTDNDHALAKDSHSLVNELVAFVGENQDEAAAAAPVVVAPPHDDAMACVMH